MKLILPTLSVFSLMLILAIPNPSYGFGINVEAETKLGDRFWIIRKIRKNRHAKLRQGIHERITREALADAERRSPYSKRYPELRQQVIYGLLFNDDPGGYLFPGNSANPKGYKYTEDSGNSIVNGIKWMERFGLVVVRMKHLYLVKKQALKRKWILSRIRRARSEKKRKKLEAKLQSDILWASHFGDLQYLHAMGQGDESRKQIITKMRGFSQHVWSAVTGKMTLSCLKNEIRRAKASANSGKRIARKRNCPVIGKAFQKRRIQLMRRFDEFDAVFHTDDPQEFRYRALGALLHMVQDSYAKGHAVRKGWDGENSGRIMFFQNYAEQDGGKHGAFDTHKTQIVDNWDKIAGTQKAMQRSSDLITYFARQCSWKGSRKDRSGCPRNGVESYLFNDVFKLARLSKKKRATRSHDELRADK